MNIVKIKDMSPIVSTKGEYNFRNKYCYAIHLKWLVPMNPGKLINKYLNELTDEQKYGLLEQDYKIAEQKDNSELESFFEEKGVAYKEIDIDVEHNIDYLNSPIYRFNLDFYYSENDKSNINQDTPGLRRYRALVARFLLRDIKRYDGENITNPRLIKFPCPKRVAMLNYYAYDMLEDKILQTLQMLQAEDSNTTKNCEVSSISINNTNTCSCQSTGLNNLSLISTIGSDCNMVRQYRSIMKETMINTFTDLDFWRWFIYSSPTQKSGAIARICDYTEALIKSELSIFDREGYNKIDLNNPCGCASSSEALYKKYIDDLNVILQAFNIMKEGIVAFESNVALITTAMSKFANYYEYLQWEQKVVNTCENWS